MAKPKHSPVPDELRAMAAEVVSRRGLRVAAEVLGVSKHTLAHVLAGLGVQSGTVALLREAQRRKEAA